MVKAHPGNAIRSSAERGVKGSIAKLSPREIVDAYLAAVASGDFERARKWLSDETFSSRSPISTYDSADAFIANISRVEAILEKVERRKMFVEGNEVCVILDYVTRMDKRQVWPVAHLMRVENGKITYMESFFDTREYAAMFVIE
jgi:limonene-1,2-epoxide hydrolase